MSMLAVFIGRLFIAVIFIVSGINKLIHVSDTSAMISASGLPGGLAIPTGLFELIAGSCIALGVATRLMSVLLAGFVLLTILFFHRDFTDPMQAMADRTNLWRRHAQSCVGERLRLQVGRQQIGVPVPGAQPWAGSRTTDEPGARHCGRCVRSHCSARAAIVFVPNFKNDQPVGSMALRSNAEHDSRRTRTSAVCGALHWSATAVYRPRSQARSARFHVRRRSSNASPPAPELVAKSWSSRIC